MIIYCHVSNSYYLVQLRDLSVNSNAKFARILYAPILQRPNQTFFVKKSFVYKNGLSNRYTLKNLLASFFETASENSDFLKILTDSLCRLYTVSQKNISKWLQKYVLCKRASLMQM
jgi:hypothetical protein